MKSNINYITFEYLLGKYLSEVKNTQTQFTYLFRKYVFPLIGNLKIDTFKFNALRVCYIELLKSTIVDHDTIETINKIIYDAFNYGISLNFISINPIKIPTNITPINTTFNPSTLSYLQVSKIINSAPSIVIKVAFSLGFKMGLSSLEILGLTWDKVDFMKHELTILNKKRKTLHNSNKMCDSRINQIPNSVYSLLLELKEYQSCFKYTSNYNNLNLIICNDNGEPFSSLTLSKVFNICCSKINIYDMTFNQTRQYFAYELFESGVNESDALKILGTIPFPPNLNPYKNKKSL